MQYGNTALYYATLNGHKEVIHLLKEKGTDNSMCTKVCVFLLQGIYVTCPIVVVSCKLHLIYGSVLYAVCGFQLQVVNLHAVSYTGNPVPFSILCLCVLEIVGETCV